MATAGVAAVPRQERHNVIDEMQRPIFAGAGSAGREAQGKQSDHDSAVHGVSSLASIGGGILRAVQRQGGRCGAGYMIEYPAAAARSRVSGRVERATMRWTMGILVPGIGLLAL